MAMRWARSAAIRSSPALMSSPPCRICFAFRLGVRPPLVESLQFLACLRWNLSASEPCRGIRELRRPLPLEVLLYRIKVRVNLLVDDLRGVSRLGARNLVGELRTMATYTDEESPSVHGFSADGTYLYFSSARDTNAERLVKLDLKTGKETLIDADPDYDLSEAIIL